MVHPNTRTDEHIAGLSRSYELGPADATSGPADSPGGDPPGSRSSTSASGVRQARQAVDTPHRPRPRLLHQHVTWIVTWTR